MTKLRYTRDELMADHDYAEPHVVAGRRMHGGFLADGTYVPPRTKVRQGAVDAWIDALRSRGGEILDAEASLLEGARLPNVEQQRVHPQRSRRAERPSPVDPRVTNHTPSVPYAQNDHRRSIHA